MVKNFANVYLLIGLISLFSAELQSNYNNERKQPNIIVYFLDVSKNEAYWASYNNEVDDFIKNNITSFYIPYRTIEGIQYIPINNLTSFLKVEYETIEDKVIISKNKDTSNKEYAKVTTDNIKVKTAFSDKESFDLIVRENEMVEIIGETENYYKVIAREKIICYIKKKNLSIINNEYQNNIQADMIPLLSYDPMIGVFLIIFIQ